MFDHQRSARPTESRVISSNVIVLREADLEALDALATANKQTIGFLTRETLRDYLNRGRVLGAVSQDGSLLGYLLFADYPDRFRIAQLCVEHALRGRGIARQLFEALKQRVTTQLVIKLKCRRDFPANNMWPRLGFVPMKEAPGRSMKALPLTSWSFPLSDDDELGLWKAQNSEEALDAVIDAQVFFLSDSDAQNAPIAKGLWNDFLSDSLNLWITDELFIEIDRQECEELRGKSRLRAHGMSRVVYSQELASHFKTVLKEILPYRTLSDQSDLHHISKTAASSLRTFVTMDEGILEHAEAIEARTGVAVLHPVELIISLHDLAQRESRSPARVSGLQLKWRRLQPDECTALPNSFQNDAERRGSLVTKLRTYLAHPDHFSCQTLESQGRIVALRVLGRSDEGLLDVPLIRVDRSLKGDLFGSFVLADLLSIAVSERRNLTRVKKHSMGDGLDRLLPAMGFRESEGHWTRVTLTQVLGRTEALRRVEALEEGIAKGLELLHDVDLEAECSPLVVEGACPCFVVPIRPTFAMGLIDRGQAADDLFGGDPSTLLRWDNVYYRTKTKHRMLQAPAKIFWYVSGSVGNIVAVSHLDEVETGSPKALFKRYQRFGVLEWRDLFDMCEGDVNRELMAMKFSRTFMLRNPVSFHQLRDLLKEGGVGASLMSPILIPAYAVKKIFQIGFPLQP